MLRLISLCLILILAGVVHFMDPYAFANSIPPFIPYKLEVIYITGALEWVLALGLLFKKSRPTFAKLTALYFTILIPIHLYVAIFSIPMFGISSPPLLVGRALFQLVFIYWAWSLKSLKS